MNLRAALLFAASACGTPREDECTKLREPFMARFQANLEASVAGGPAHGTSLVGLAPDRSAATTRELAHVRGNFVASCRAVGAPAIAKCMTADPPRGESCRALDKQLEEKLYAGFDP